MGRKKIVNYVKSNSRPTGKHLPEYNFGSFQVFIQDPLPEHVDIKKIFSEIENLLNNCKRSNEKESKEQQVFLFLSFDMLPLKV